LVQIGERAGAGREWRQIDRLDIGRRANLLKRFFAARPLVTLASKARPACRARSAAIWCL
jgi:hypothetical protein